jgi:hypothetical protein
MLILRELRQWQFYEGLLEGLPTVEMNRRRLEYFLGQQCGKIYGADPLLIRPTEKPIESWRDEPYPFGEPAAFPSILCMARFDSLQPARDPRKDFSGLVVVWFQEEFAFPIDPEALEQLRAIDWERHAVDLVY